MHRLVSTPPIPEKRAKQGRLQEKLGRFETTHSNSGASSMAAITKENILNALLADGRGSRTYAELGPKFKAVLLNTIHFDLNRCEHENGTDFCIEVWAHIQRELALMDWGRKCGPFALWKSTYRKASLLVSQSQPKQIGQEAASLLETLKIKSREVVKGTA